MTYNVLSGTLNSTLLWSWDHRLDEINMLSFQKAEMGDTDTEAMCAH